VSAQKLHWYVLVIGKGWMNFRVFLSLRDGFLPLRGGFVCAARKVLVPSGGFVSLRDGFGGLRPGIAAAKPHRTVAKGHKKPQHS